MLEIRLVARCYPTEDPAKVARAISNLFPDALIEGNDPLVGVSASVDTLVEQLRRQKIRDAARAVIRLARIFAYEDARVAGMGTPIHCRNASAGLANRIGPPWWYLVATMPDSVRKAQ